MEFRPFHVELSTRFRGLTSRSGVLIKGRGADGGEAWGEYSPFPDYRPEQANRWWAAAMESARGEWPAPVRDQVDVASIVPEVPAQDAGIFAAANGCRTAKVKVGGEGSVLQDAARVEAAARALGPGGRVRVDANGTWSVDAAVRAIAELELAARRGGLDGLEYVEQPCASVEELAVLRRRVDTLIAADESVRLPGDVRHVVEAKAADILVLKPHPMGGVRACLDIVEAVEMPVVVSSAMETSVGLAACLALALAMPDQPYAHGLGTGELLASDTVERTLIPVDGVMTSQSQVVTV